MLGALLSSSEQRSWTQAGPALVLILLLGCGGGDDVGKDRFGDSDGGGDVGGAGGAHGGSSSSSGSDGGAGPASSSASSGSGGPSFVEHCFDGVGLKVFPLDLTEGDAEFEGHGPNVKLDVTAKRDGSAVVITACVDMQETQSDWTTGHACKSKSFEIAGLVGIDADAFEASYVDHDHGYDTLESSDVFDPSPLVSQVGCQGDRDGSDVCNDSGCAFCEVALGCLQVQIAE